MLEVAQQLASAGLPVFPCSASKTPAVPKGVPWGLVATLQPDQLNWPSGLAGIPIPAGAVVLDLDTYKGATRQQVEQALSCALPWNEAFIQNTLQGGEHYAFAVDWDVLFGSNMFGVHGLDTRTVGKGYICTGEGYSWAGFGPLRLSDPGTMLPRLPDGARLVTEQVQREVTSVDLPQGDRDVTLIREALQYISSDCSRTEWVATGMALKHHFHDAQDVGFALFKEWSEYHADRLDYDTLEQQWGSFKVFNADGASVTIASVIYKAMQAGWVPPGDINTALAFGAGAASVEVFGLLIDRIQESGGDPKLTSELIDAIKSTECSDIQRATLLATLHRELKDAGLLTKQVRAALDAAVTGKVAAADTTHNAPGRYGKNHTENAAMFLDQRYPASTLLRADEVWYFYNGKCWGELSEGQIKSELFNSMYRSYPQDNTINGTYGVLCKMCHTMLKIGRVPSNLIVYANGVLDLNTWTLNPHSPEYFTTNLLPYNYSPQAPCRRWLSFLHEVFEGDDERIALLQEWLGYLLSSSYRFHKIMLLLGPPRSGKGTIGRILARLVGEQNFSGGSLHAFASDKFLDSLRTKPVMFVGDAEQKISRNQVGIIIERILTISGNDAISFDRIYKSSITEALPTRITLSSNHTPSLFDDSGALAGRFVVLPINVSFMGREDPYLFDVLITELEGIAAWSLAGLHRLSQKGRFILPQASLDEMQYVVETYSPLERFIDDVCEPVAGSVITSEDTYLAYRAWATAQQEDNILARRTFISAFKDATRGRFKYGTHHQLECGRGFKGVKLRPVKSAGTAGAFTVIDGGRD